MAQCCDMDCMCDDLHKHTKTLHNFSLAFLLSLHDFYHRSYLPMLMAGGIVIMSVALLLTHLIQNIRRIWLPMP